MGYDFPSRITPEFNVSLEQRDDRWVVVCSRILDVPDAAALVQPELLKLHEAVVAQRVGRVALEVQDVEYMNSSGLKSFMAWFLTAANVRENPYRIEVQFDPARSWQQLSFRPMERLAPDTVTLVPRGAEGAGRA